MNRSPVQADRCPVVRSGTTGADPLACCCLPGSIASLALATRDGSHVHRYFWLRRFAAVRSACRTSDGMLICFIDPIAACQSDLRSAMRKADKYPFSAVAIVTAILMTTNGALAEATIDAGAKPYFIAGGVIATVFFISVGAMLIRKGNRYLRIAAAAAQWPIVTGEVVSTDVVERIDRTQDGPNTYFVPQVRYVYHADGVRRDGSVIRVGMENSGYPLERQARECLA